MRTNGAQRLIFIVTFDAATIVTHNHGLENGRNERAHGRRGPVQTDTRNHQRNAGVGDFTRKGAISAKHGMKIGTIIGGRCRCLLQTNTG